MDSEIRRRATVHAALGDPARLVIVEELAITDRSPKELADLLGIATNLLAHHLDVLSAVGLIERFVSSGDRRRRYVRLVADRLAEVALPAARPAGPALFVCTHNSARSQLAAALWKARTGCEASSAGTHPADRVHPRAVSAARRAGLDLGGARPRLLGDPSDGGDGSGRVVTVTVCDRAHEELVPDPSWWHWSIPDPVEAGNDAAFDAVIDHLDARIGALGPLAEEVAVGDLSAESAVGAPALSVGAQGES